MTKPNILFISIEDLNDWIEPLGGHPDTITPNLTRLANAGTNFEAAYTNVPACSPSRTATLFGQAPWNTGLYNNGHVWSQYYAKGKRLSLVGCLRDAGYTTIGAGKIFFGSNKGIDPDDWDTYAVNKRVNYRPVSEQARNSVFRRNKDFGPAPNNKLTWDEKNTQSIIDSMVSGSSSMFWGLGIFRPHLPFVVPQQYFDKMPEKVAEPPGLNGRPFAAGDTWDLDDTPAEARALIKTAKIGEALEQFGNYNDYLKSYLASITFADSLLGKVLDRLEAEGLSDNTYIILWSDHGWQFGEKTAFKKFTLWERALRIPFMISGPGIKKQNLKVPVSLLDLFPTMMTLGKATEKHKLDGDDLSILLKGDLSWQRDYVCSAYSRDLVGSDTAFSIRTTRYRYTRYWSGGEELYDHNNDPYEITNLLDTAHAGRNDASAAAEHLKSLIPENPVPQIEIREENLGKIRQTHPLVWFKLKLKRGLTRLVGRKN